MIDLQKEVFHNKKSKHYLIVHLRMDIVKDLDLHQLNIKEWKESKIIAILNKIFQLIRVIIVKKRILKAKNLVKIH